MSKKAYAIIAAQDSGPDAIHSLLAVCSTPKSAVKLATEYNDPNVSDFGSVIIQLLVGNGDVYDAKEIYYTASGKRMKSYYDRPDMEKYKNVKPFNGYGNEPVEAPKMTKPLVKQKGQKEQK